MSLRKRHQEKNKGKPTSFPCRVKCLGFPGFFLDFCFYERTEKWVKDLFQKFSDMEKTLGDIERKVVVGALGAAWEGCMRSLLSPPVVNRRLTIFLVVGFLYSKRRQNPKRSYNIFFGF